MGSAVQVLMILAVVGPAALLPGPASAATVAGAVHRRSLKGGCDSFCSDKNSGYYANPCDSTCSSFIQCANGMTYTTVCPSGLRFNPSVSVCDWASNVQCDDGPTDSSPPPPAKKSKPPPPAKKSKPPPPAKKSKAPPPPKQTKRPPPGQKPPPPGDFAFGAYKDITINLDWNTYVMSTSITGTRTPVTQVMSSKDKVLTWSFATGECGAENWAGATPASIVTGNVDAFVSAGKQYIIATGGAAGSFRCGSDAGFTQFLQRYDSAGFIGVDFDIEGGQSQSDIEALVARVRNARSGVFNKLRYSFTLATLGGSSGNQLNTLGTWTMNAIKNSGLSWNNLYINLMVMDYGGACTVFKNGVCDMGTSAINAAKALHDFWGVPYSSIELTPMIGGNDSPGQTFTLEDVDLMSAFVRQNGLGGVHFWSLDRDTDCPPGAASATCNSYGKAGNLGFTNRFITALGL